MKELKRVKKIMRNKIMKGLAAVLMISSLAGCAGKKSTNLEGFSSEDGEHTTKIDYRVNNSGNVEISLYNILGQKVETLLDTEKERRKYNFVFGSSGYPEGIYFCRIESNGKIFYKKIGLGARRCFPFFRLKVVSRLSILFFLLLS